MPEKKLRSILLGLLLWILNFTAATLVALKLNDENIKIFILIVIPIFTAVLAYIYMRSPQEKSVYEGTRLGLTWFVLLLTIDVIVKVYLMKYGWEYFRSWTVWISFGEIIFLCGVIGALMKPIKEEMPTTESEQK